MKRLAPVLLALWHCAAAIAQQAPAGPRCADQQGAWSSTTGGLRARLVSSGTRPDRSALAVSLELENTLADATLELHWLGGLEAGFFTPRLALPDGREVPPPGWAFGGNQPVGRMVLRVAPRSTVRVLVAPNLYTRFMNGRALRVGAFWGRAMPSDGSTRLFGGTVAGAAPPSEQEFELRTEYGSEVAREARPAPPNARAWVANLAVPGLCVE